MTLTNIQPALRFLFSASIVFAVVAAVAATSGAFSTVTPASAEDITFTTGTASLLIAADSSGIPSTYGQSITGPTFTGLTPGEEETFTFWLKNNSDDDMELDLSADLFEKTSGDTLEDDLDIIFSCDVRSSTNRDGDSPEKSLAAWYTDLKEALDEGGDPFPGRLGGNDGVGNGTSDDEAKCVMTTTLDPTSDAQGVTVSFDADFTGETPPPPV